MHTDIQNQTPDSSPSRTATVLLTCVDVLIGILILVLPFVMGGREAWGHWLLITAAGSLGGCWCTYAAVSGLRYRISWLEVFFLAGLAIALFQLQPQSADQLAQYSTEYERLLPDWTNTQAATAQQKVPAATATQEAAPTASWNTLSFTPAETLHGVRVLLAYCLIALVFFQRLKSQQDCERALRTVAVSGVVMATFGLLQWSSSNGKFFWVYEHPFTDPTEHLKAAFTNRNHFAQFLALSVGPLLWWLVMLIRRAIAANADPSGHRAIRTTSTNSANQNTRQKKRSAGTAFTLDSPESARMLSIPILIVVVCLATVGLSVLMSLSRGGMIAAAAAVGVSSIGLWRGFKRSGTIAAVILGTSVIVFSTLAVVGQDQVQTRLEQLISGDAEKMDAGGVRRAVWAADAKVIEKFPYLGTGIGSHRDVYSLYMDDYADFATFELTHAESTYVHLALEAGLVGCGLLILALLWFGSRLCWAYFRQKSYEQRAITVAVASSAAGAILHAVTDFIWYVPALVVTSLILVAVGLNSVSRRHPEEIATGGIPLPRFVWAKLAVMCLLACGWVQNDLLARIDAERHWYASLNTKLNNPLDDDGYENLKPGDTIVLDDENLGKDRDEPKELTPEQKRQHRLAEVDYLKTRIQHLRKCIQARPDQHRPQIMMAENLLRLFDLLQAESANPLPLNMIRDAAVAAEFQSKEELQDWLDKACEDRIQLVHLADKLSRQALANCPVQGYGYLNLLETSFTRHPKNERAQKLLDQALLVRAHDPRVTYIAGREALMANDRETAFKHWNTVFHSSEYFRMNILKMLAPQVNAAFFVHQFQPGGVELMDLLRVYIALDRPMECDLIRRKLCQVIPEESPEIEDEDERLRLMLFASQFAIELEDHTLAAQILAQTLKDFPTSYDAHHRMGVTLYELENFDAAVVHLMWCHEWDPGDQWVPEMIRASRHKMAELADVQAEAKASGIQRASWRQPARTSLR